MHVETEYDKTRGNVALARLATALGVRIWAEEPDHVILERLADRASRIQLGLEYLRPE